MSGARSGDGSVPDAGTSEVTRVVTSGAIGLGVSAVLLFFAPWQVTVLAGWIVGAATFVARVWYRINPLDGPATKAISTSEDASRASAHFLVIGASLASLAGVGFTLARASETSGGTKLLLTVTAILTVMTSWVLVHTVFALRYAHAYYGDPEGGIDFSSDETPDYHDFAYVSFTIGMTFQIASP